MIELCSNKKDFPFGLRCIDCNKDITDEPFYARRYLEENVAEIICVQCSRRMYELMEKLKDRKSASYLFKSDGTYEKI